MQTYKRRGPSATTTQMIVPDHILATGEEAKYATLDAKNRANRLSLLEQMTVPDRIVMDGGDRYKGFEATPREVIRMDNILDVKTDADMMHVPQTLTVAETSSPDEAVKRPVSANEDVLSTSSIAIEENPLQQLKIMRRQLTTISQRLYDLEEEKDRQRNRNMLFAVTTLLSTALAALMIFVRR